MPDPTYTDALAEAIALAPADDVVIDTLEIRHETFVDDDGNPDSIWITTNGEDVEARIEAGAPLKGGQTVRFLSFPFKFKLGRIEPGAGAELTIEIDGVDRRIIEALDRAIVEPTKIIMVYRVFLSSDLEDGPQRLPPDSFVLSECDTNVTKVVGRARIEIDMTGPFPRYLYTANEYPGLIGQ